VEKLEMVLAAEESGRRLVAEARERAARTCAAADSKARETVVRGAETALKKASDDHDRILGKAGEETAAFTAVADAGREAAIEAARGRLAGVAATLTKALRG
jgi:vacuolar-type H+-ATPase subunit H